MVYRLVSRRRLLAIGVAIAAGSALAACAADAMAPESFLSLSEWLTGVSRSDLDRGAARAYFRAMEVPASAVPALAGLQEAAGDGSGPIPGSAAALRAKGIFEQPDARAEALRLTAYWYRGQIASFSGPASAPPKVVTYANALGWKALSFAAAPATCGGAFGFWSSPPAA